MINKTPERGFWGIPNLNSIEALKGAYDVQAGRDEHSFAYSR